MYGKKSGWEQVTRVWVSSDSLKEISLTNKIFLLLCVTKKSVFNIADILKHIVGFGFCVLKVRGVSVMLWWFYCFWMTKWTLDLYLNCNVLFYSLMDSFVLRHQPLPPQTHLRGHVAPIRWWCSASRLVHQALP